MSEQQGRQIATHQGGPAQGIVNAISVDVEDYFHATAFAGSVRRSQWATLPQRVVDNTHRLLRLFEERNVRATFFVLGWVAERHPDLVRKIAAEGHEVACHGYSHELIYRQSVNEFRKETIRAKSVLEDILQTRVEGYRAASYSITDKSLWALDILVELGFRYDSSIFPIRHDRYGVPGAPRFPYRIRTSSGNTITEVPLATWSLFGWRLPVAGGGYFRLYPYRLTEFALKWINRREGASFIFYIHPWEIDPEQPRLRSSRLTQWRHYTNLGRTQERLGRLLSSFSFNSIEHLLQIERAEAKSMRKTWESAW